MHQEEHYPILHQENTERERMCKNLVNCQLTRNNKGIRLHEIEKPGSLGSNPKP